MHDILNEKLKKRACKGLPIDRPARLVCYFEVLKSLHNWLNRLSQKKSVSWEKLKRMLKHNPLPKPPEYRKLK